MAIYSSLSLYHRQKYPGQSALPRFSVLILFQVLLEELDEFVEGDVIVVAAVIEIRMGCDRDFLGDVLEPRVLRGTFLHLQDEMATRIYGPQENRVAVPFSDEDATAQYYLICKKENQKRLAALLAH